MPIFFPSQFIQRLLAIYCDKNIDNGYAPSLSLHIG